MRAAEFVSEKWSEKYKRSINCANPRGFSQRAHCAGRKKNEDVVEGSGNGYYYLQGGIERSKKFASEAEAMAHSKQFFQLARVSRVTLKYKEPGQPPVVVKEFTFNSPPPPKSQMSWGDFYLQGKKQGMSEEQLDELTFKGSPCTKDCSGHRAGYEWSRRKGGVDAASWSRSFNNGAALFKNGF